MFFSDDNDYAFNLDRLISQGIEIDYAIALSLTTELVALEVLNRVFVTLYEVRVIFIKASMSILCNRPECHFILSGVVFTKSCSWNIRWSNARKDVFRDLRSCQ